MTRSDNLKKAQKNYEMRKKEANPEAYKADRAQYMREYRRKKKEEIFSLNLFQNYLKIKRLFLKYLNKRNIYIL